MTRILIHVEGQTEETFTNVLIAPHLYANGYLSVGARLLGNSRARLKRGGIRDWPVVLGDIDRRLRHDAGLSAGLLVDYYALPDTWPGRLQARQMPVEERGRFVEQSVTADFEQQTGFHGRFEPHILMHEFEALLFSDCARFAESIGHSDKAEALQNVADQFLNPEHINDNPQTAPSKRVLNIIPGYQKPLFGAVAAMGIGLDQIRQSCPNFDNWMNRLEARVV